MATKATVPLKIVISGAGLVGLATAASLVRAGHSVTLLESKDDLSEIGAGIQLPPNSSRILINWGLKERVEQASEQSSLLRLRRYATGEVLRQVKGGNVKFGMPIWLIHRAELQKILYDYAIAGGVQIKFNHRITEIDCNGPTVQCENGDSFNADLVLLAEGIGSKNRKYVVDEEESAPRVLHNAYRIMIPRADMEKDEELAELMNSQTRDLWTGPGRYIIAYPISQSRFYNIVLAHSGEPEPGVWNKPGDLNEVEREFEDFEPRVLKLIRLAQSCMDWTLARLPPLSRWADESGKVLLIGDTAHATTPEMAQGAAMGLEDAVVLTECLANLQSQADIPQATSEFEALRKERTEKIQQESWRNAHDFILPDGPEQEERDLKWKSGKAESDENIILQREFLEWLYGSDVAQEAKNHLEKHSLDQGKLYVGL